MLNDIIFSLPDGRDAIVRLDTALDKNEIRVGSLGALDQFLTDRAKTPVRTPRAERTYPSNIVRLNAQHIIAARKWMWQEGKVNSLKGEEAKAMLYFFPKDKEGMQNTKALEGNHTPDLTPERARKLRNNVLRRIGVLP